MSLSDTPAAPTMTLKPSLAGMTRAEIADALRALGLPEREIRMRVSQLWHWIYFRGARDFGEMLNVSKAMRAQLADAFALRLPEIVEEQISVDGTRKWLLRLQPVDAFDKGAEVECVYIPESDRGTLCVSSQVGCTLELQLLPHGHAAARAQSDDAPRSSASCSSPASGSAIFPIASGRRTGSCRRAKACAPSPTSSSWAWASRSTISTMSWRRSRSWPTATGWRCPSAASPFRPPASCRRSSAWAPNAGRRWRFRCTRCATNCATSSCR